MWGRRDGRVFVTTDAKNQATALRWAEHATDLALSSSASNASNASNANSEGGVFGSVGEGGFVTATTEQLEAALGAVDGAMGEAYRAKKNVFSVAALNTNHVFSVGVRRGGET